MSRVVMLGRITVIPNKLKLNGLVTCTTIINIINDYNIISTAILITNK